MSNKLTTKQRLFVEAYLGKANGNATEAARLAGYSGNENTLGVTGLRLLRNAKIAVLVEKRIEKEAMTATEVLNELADIAKSDWREFLQIRRDKDGNEIDAILKLNDKIKALELLGKHYKLFTERHEVKADIETASTIVVQGIGSDIENPTEND